MAYTLSSSADHCMGMEGQAAQSCPNVWLCVAMYERDVCLEALF